MAKQRPWGNLKQVKNRGWTSSYELYSQAPNFYSGYYYIHKHKENIGRMGLQKAETDSSLAELFNSYKYGKDAILSNTLTNQYLSLMYAASPDLVDLVNETLNPENSAQNILDRIQNALQQGFENQFTPNKIIQMLNIEKSTNWTISSKNKKNNNADAIALMKMLSQDDASKAKQGFAFLDEILTGMTEAVRLLNSEEGAALVSVLSNMIRKRHYSIQSLGKDFHRILDSFVKHHNGDTINGADTLKAVQLMLPIAEALETGKTKKGKKLSLDSLQGLVQKQFYSMLAEIFVTHIQEAAQNAAVKYIVDSVNDINNGAGTDEVEILVTNPDGTYPEGASTLNDGEKKYGKADAKFNNVQVSTEVVTGRDDGYFKMSVGISNKAYIINHIGEGSLKKFNVYSLGGGMTIGNALSLLLGTNGHIRERYLAYNIFSHPQRELPLALNALQDTLLTRSIIYLAGARGKDDFAQFMLLNGELLSVWDIVKFAMGNDIGRSSSQQGHNNSGIYLSIPNRKTILRYAQSRFWTRRVVKTNVTITNAAMKAHIVPKQIIEYASANMPKT